MLYHRPLPIRLGLLVACLGWFLSIPNLYASFLDETAPARSAALGGNAVAAPEGSSSLYDNPAGLAFCDTYLAAARYQRLMEGIENDDLGTSSIGVLGPAGRWGGWGASWDHFGANHLQRDRVRLSGGRSCPIPASWGSLGLGLSLSLLSQRYSLSEPLSSVSPEHLSATALSFGAGFLWKPFVRFSFALSGEDLTRPSLGVVSNDRFEAALKMGGAYDLPLQRAGKVTFLAGLQRTTSKMEPQGGLEWALPRIGVSLRTGVGRQQASVGFGFSRGGLTLDYAYVFSSSSAASLDGTGLPANHLFELLWRWGGRFTPEDPDGYAALMRKASEDERQSKWNEALWIYRRALQKMPDDSKAQAGWERTLTAYNHERANHYLTFGRQAELRGFSIEAQHNYEWALQLDPSMQEAQEALTRVKAEVPSGAFADSRVVRWIQEAVALAAQGDHTHAAEILQKAQGLYPQDRALEDFTKVLTAAPVTQTILQADPSVERLMAEAEIYQRKGRADLASNSWKQVLSVDPQNIQAAEKLKESHSKTPSSRAIPSADRQKAQFFYEQGLKAYLSGDVHEAIKDWETSLTYDPSHENALNNLARARLEITKYGTAVLSIPTVGEKP
jgi:tetratricopeptide (TPR) repeat protein